ncbi:hypothetical protein ACJ72_08043, partial [Emergomyces africanus]
VLVLIYGTGVHIYNSLRLKRFSAVVATATASAVRSPEKLEMGDDDIPFGSRAIERGIEIEGIWISNHNTPAGSPAAKSRIKIDAHFPSPSPSSLFKGGSDFLSPKAAATIVRCKPASVSSPLPYPGFYESANASSSGISGRRAKSEFFSRHEQESESQSHHIPQSDNGYSEFEFGELGGVGSSDQQQESGYSSMNSRTAENGSSTFGNQESNFTAIAT